MDELIHKLGINWKLLIAQAVNFTIVLIVLYKYVYKPVLKMLQNRENKISKSLKDAEQVEENLKKSKIERENQIALGRKQGEKIIEQMRFQAEQLKIQTLEQSKKEANAIIKEAKNNIKLERAQMVEEAKNELGELILLASQKVTKQSIDPETHGKLIDEAVNELKRADIK